MTDQAPFTIQAAGTFTPPPPPCGGEDCRYEGLELVCTCEGDN